MSLNESLEYRLAMRYVDDFADELLIRDHHSAMECCDCEELLSKGIVACQWLDRMESTLREASYVGLIDFSGEAKEAVVSLYHAWLKGSEGADRWIENLAGRGYRPENIARYEECQAEIRDRIQQRAWLSLARKARQTRSSEEVAQ